MTRKEYANRYYNEIKEALKKGNETETIVGICWAIAEDTNQGDRMKVMRLEELFKAYNDAVKSVLK